MDPDRQQGERARDRGEHQSGGIRKMSTYTTRMFAGTAINFAPASEAEEISQNICMILGTVKGEAPFARGFGVDASAQDEPDLVAQARFTGAAIEAIAEYEPRAAVDSIIFEQTDMERADGQFVAVVRWRRAEEGEDNDEFA
ncbi:hypothetical protein B9G55_01485 [Saccharibacillus sp. O16]|nr:hypothetical protein B9G55_01485 [Saccharibacillus sp. O16]